MLYFLSGLKGVPLKCMSSAEIDGANAARDPKVCICSQIGRNKSNGRSTDYRTVDKAVSGHHSQTCSPLLRSLILIMNIFGFVILQLDLE